LRGRNLRAGNFNSGICCKHMNFSRIASSKARWYE
jgi:hypothetical protein